MLYCSAVGAVRLEKILGETNRLILRRFEKRDFRDLYAYLSDEAVVRFEPYRPMTEAQVREELESRITSGEMIAVEEKKSGKLIGHVYMGQRDCSALRNRVCVQPEILGSGLCRGNRSGRTPTFTRCETGRMKEA